MSKYLKNAAQAVANPPQSEPLDKNQVKNSAGGYSYPVDKWVQFDRFMILGTEGGSYYATEKKLTKENLDAVAKCIEEDGIRAVNRIIEISDAGRAPKNDPALLALAYAAGVSKKEVRQAALAALPRVARIGTHLFHFVDYVQEFRGWGSALKKAVANWYESMDADRLADQVTKYQQRDGMSHRDLLRLSHPHFTDQKRHATARWVLGLGLGEVRNLKDKDGNTERQYPSLGGELPNRIQGHVLLQACTNAKEAARIIRQYDTVRESVPTELLKAPEVWEALLEKMPMTAMIRNLGNLSKCGLVAPMSNAAREVVKKLGDVEALKKARVHPIQILIAQMTYDSGHGVRGKGEWTVVPQVTDALDGTYYAAFDFVEPTGKRFYLGMDISGSMFSGVVAGVQGLTPAIASGAMAMVTVKTEPWFYSAGFTGQMEKISLSKKQRLDDVVRIMHNMQSRMGSTDCALPMIDAMDKRLPVDVFAVYTDSETWYGGVHPMRALQDYRQKMGIAAKLVVVGMVGNHFTIADPNDAGTMDVVGFDTATPTLIADFARQ